MTAKWYVAQLKPNGLRLATRNLERQGFAVFCPQKEEPRRVRGKLAPVRVPLFPGYLFVSVFPERGNWRLVNNTRGISRLVVLDGSGPRPVPEELIEALRMRCSDEDVLLPPDDIAAGEAVRLTGGPFAGYVSRVEDLAPDRRVWVLLELMGRATRVKIDMADVERLAS